MKKSYICPLDVTSLKVAISDPSTDVGVEFPAFEAFDSRRDQSITFDNFKLSISLLVTNMRHSERGYAVGIHRPIAITVIDKMSDKLLVSKTVWVTIPKGETSKQLRVDIPLSADNVDFDSLYVVYLRDALTDTHLIEKDIAFYDERDNNPIAKDWVVEGASITSHLYERKFRSYKANERTHIKVRFDLARMNKYHESDFPEMEIRIFFPDGSVIRDFCVVGFDNFDDCDMGKYRAEICFKPSKNAIGVCYAELLCLEEAINGFVFSIDDKAKEGVWASDELQIMDYYEADSYAERYESLTGDEAADDSEPIILDSDFERMLGDFISSQMTDESNDSEEVDDDSGNGDEEPETSDEECSDSKCEDQL